VVEIEAGLRTFADQAIGALREASMRYLCLCYYDQPTFEALTKDELAALGRRCQPHDEALRRSGHLSLVGSLALPSESRTLRAGRGGPSVSEGPFAATQEPLGAFFMIEADDLDQAVEVASKHPGAQLTEFGGGIEVRPIDIFDQPQRS
jgi:hypothetical protein